MLLKKDSRALVQQMMKMLERDIITNELFQIYQGDKEESKTFDELAEKYNESRKEIEELTVRRSEIRGVVESLMVEFMKDRMREVNMSRIRFLKRVDAECNVFNECHNSLQSGAHFHSQLAAYLDKLMQTVNDYVVTRKVQREILQSRLLLPPK